MNSALLVLFFDSREAIKNSPSRSVTGRSLDSPENGNVENKSPKNVEKMSEKCPGICPEGLQTQFSDIFGTIFAYLVHAFEW